MTSIYVAVAIYGAVMVGVAIAWWKSHAPTYLSILLTIVLTFSVILFGVQQRNQHHQNVRNARECADVSAAADAINSFGNGVRNFIVIATARLYDRLKTEKPGTPAYMQDKAAADIYQDLINSIKTVHVTECKLVTNKH